MNIKKFHDMHFDSIQTLRGIAAVLVVMEHIRFLACGAFGVDIFFCISGFMIMFTTHKSTENFFRKRLIRIVPFYYLMTLGTFGLLVLFPSMFEQTHASFTQLMKSLLFIPFDMGGGVIQPLLRIGWTINCEMFFYLLFGIALHISHRYRGLICSLLLFLCVAIGAFASGGATLSGTAVEASSLESPLFFYGSPIMLEFVLGILCYDLCRGFYEASLNAKFAYLLSGKCRILFLILGLSLLAAMMLTTRHVNILGYRRLLCWGLPAMAAVLAFFLAGLSLTMPAWSVRLGDISFSLYLIHYYPIMFLDRKVFDFSSFRVSSALGAVCGLLLVIALAYVAWYFMEKKLTGWLKGKIVVPRRQHLTTTIR